MKNIDMKNTDTNLIPDIKVKLLTYGSDIYSTPKLSSILARKVEIDNISVDTNTLDHTDIGNITHLSVAAITQDTFDELYATNKIDPNVFYSVTSELLNGLNRRVINVAAPTDNTDAVNKKYVDDKIQSILSILEKHNIM